MTTAQLSNISALINQGLLQPHEEPLARRIIAEHGMATFAAFLTERQRQEKHGQDAIQAEMNRILNISEETFRKYSK